MDYLDEVMAAYTAVADVYDDVFRVTETTEKHAIWLLDLLERIGAKRVVDAAVGTGDELLSLVRSGAFEILVANDMNTAMLGRCKEKLRAAGARSEQGWPEGKVGCYAPIRPLEPDTFYNYYASHDEQTPVVLTRQNWELLDRALPKGAFDAVLCTGIGFYHCMTTDRFIAALQCWHRLLRDGGCVVIDYPYREADAHRMRAGTYVPNKWDWHATELAGRSGRRYVVAFGDTHLPLQGGPVGWRSWSTWHIGELTEERQVPRAWSLTTGGAVLDAEAMKEIAEASGFSVVDTDSPPLAVDVPASDALESVHHVLLCKP